MRKFRLYESWHNRCDNAENIILGEYDTLAEAQTALGDEISTVLQYGLGDDFGPVPDAGHFCRFTDSEPVIDGGHNPTVTATGRVASFWYGEPTDDESGFFLSERRRRFVIRPTWDFVWEQESLNPAFRGFYTGIISDGEDFLFFRANREDNLCEVFASIEEMCEDGPIVSYPWSSGNDSLLLETLDTTPFDRIVNRGMCDHSASALRQVDFPDDDE